MNQIIDRFCKKGYILNITFICNFCNPKKNEVSEVEKLLQELNKSNTELARLTAAFETFSTKVEFLANHSEGRNAFSQSYLSGQLSLISHDATEQLNNQRTRGTF